MCMLVLLLSEVNQCCGRSIAQYRLNTRVLISVICVSHLLLTGSLNNRMDCVHLCTLLLGVLISLSVKTTDGSGMFSNKKIRSRCGVARAV